MSPGYDKHPTRAYTCWKSCAYVCASFIIHLLSLQGAFFSGFDLVKENGLTENKNKKATLTQKKKKKKS